MADARIIACICPPERNEPHCPRHASAARALFNQTPIYCQIAWEMDLSWADRPERLFWQHSRRLSLWPFFYNSFRERMLEGPVFGKPAWVAFKTIAHPMSDLSEAFTGPGALREGFLRFDTRDSLEAP